MAKQVENKNSNGGCDIDDSNRNESGALYPSLVSSSKPLTSASPPPAAPVAAQQQLHSAQQHQPQQQQQQSCGLQQTAVSYRSNGHSRNPSSINGITTTTQAFQPPPNKPDAINNFLKIIRFRSECEDNDEKSQNRQICGIREARLISKWSRTN